MSFPKVKYAEPSTKFAAAAMLLNQVHLPEVQQAKR